MKAETRDKRVDKRICYGCNSTYTHINIDGFEHWFLNLPTDLLLCQKCYYKYVVNPRSSRFYSTKRILFRDKQIYLKDKPRIGKCSKCNRMIGQDVKRTSMHHRKYHNENILKDTEELCQSCHSKTIPKDNRGKWA